MINSNVNINKHFGRILVVILEPHNSMFLIFKNENHVAYWKWGLSDVRLSLLMTDNTRGTSNKAVVYSSCVNVRMLSDTL